MRIIAGKKRRMKLRSPRGRETRPMLERVRESLFMRLEPHLEDARVLDLFAGAGTLGFEALSRGAAEATFVDSSPAAVKTLRENADALDLTDRATVIKDDALRFLGGQPPEGRPFDLLLIGPPYGQGYGPRVLAKLSEDAARWLSPLALIVVQVGRRDPLEPAYGNLRRTSERLYGETRVEMFRYEPEGSSGSSAGEDRP